MNPITIIFAIFSGIVCVLFGWAAYGVIRIILKIRQTTTIAIASIDDVSWSAEHLEMIGDLQALGFRELVHGQD